MFIDSSGWAALLDRKQTFHSQAARAFHDFSSRGAAVVTSNFILAELTGLLTSPLRISKLRQIQFIRSVRSSALIEVVAIDATTEAEAWTLWESRPDKSWSLIDCSTFVLMQKRGIAEALTADHHFEQAGFVRLLK